MRTTITEAEVTRYQRDGFLVIDDFLSADDLEQWRFVVETAARARQADPGEHTNNESDEYYQKVFTQLAGLRALEPKLNALLTDPRIGQLAARLEGVEGIRLWMDQALFKPPFGNPTGWHLDTPFWSFEDRRALTLWVALDDATVENGCMWYLPGTHKEARFDAFEIGSNLGGIFDAYPQWRSIESQPAVLPAGGAIWHNGLTAHGAGANMTAKGRRAMTCAYMPDGVTYNGHREAFVFSAEYASRLAVGAPLDDEELNPLVWSARDPRLGQHELT